ncbi:MAG: S9 family peptidase, partial [Pseudomonadota bacterium]
MYKLLLFTSLFLAVFSTSAAKIIDDEHVTKETDCFTGIFADYDSWHQFIAQKNKRKAKNEEAYLKRIKAFEETFPQDMFDNFKANLTCHNFKYQVDNVEVLGYIIKPKVIKNKLPVLIYNRGGNGNFGSVYFAAMMRNLFPLAEQGFVVIGSQYRGTS